MGIRFVVRLVVIVSLLGAAGACEGEAPDDPPASAPPQPAEPSEAGTAEDAAQREPAPSPEPPKPSPPDRGSRSERASRPDPDRFLPPLPDYRVDDSAEGGELESSLDHGAIPYESVRRRLILDQRGFTRGEITVVTFDAGEGAIDRYLDHRFGEARRAPVEIGGVEMLRIGVEPHPVLAWVGGGFAVTFARSAEASEEWLHELARATARVAARAAARAVARAAGDPER